MKVFNRTSLVDSIVYNSKRYTCNGAISGAMNANNTHLNVIQYNLKLQGRSAILVIVLPTSLKGKTDLHGRLYAGTRHIFTTD
jgi:hypothetical protein